MKEKIIGILITKKNYSESSLILSFYSSEYGLITLIFKGAKKKKHPIFYLGIYEITFFKRPDSNLGIIQAIDPAVVLTDIFTNPQKVILSFFLVDVLKETLKAEQPDSKMFQFIKNQILEMEVQGNLIHFPVNFLTLLIKNLGFSPIIDADHPTSFDIRSGRFSREYSEIETDVVMLLYSTFKDIQLSFDLTVYKKALVVLLDYCKIHLPNFNVDKSLKIIKDTLYE